LPHASQHPSLLPSIDVLECSAVKLVRGVPGTGLRLGDPWRLAEFWSSLGASMVHVVDLDGAMRGRPSSCVLGLVKRMVSELGLGVQLGGGLRDIGVLEEAYSIGASRLVVASAWLRNPGFLAEAVDRLGDGVLVAALEESWEALPARAGWRGRAPLSVAEAVRLAGSVKGLFGLMYTQVFHEGEMRGVDVLRASRLSALAREAGVERLIYSGGVASARDLEVLGVLGFSEAVVGMAIYTWRLNPLGWLS